MKCKDYREAIAADPSESFDGGAHHSADCRACAEVRDGMRALDEDIASALAIEVPELKLPELPPIEAGDENVVNLPFRKKGRVTTPVWLGLAASVALAAVVGVRFLADDVGYDSLADEVLAHMDHEPYSRVVTDDSVSGRQLGRVIRTKATLDDNIGLISYAKSCVINGREIPHLVIQGQNGPITLLLMPHEAIERTITLEGKNIYGVIVPVDNGSIAIIGQRAQDVGEIKEQVVDSVTWSI